MVTNSWPEKFLSRLQLLIPDNRMREKTIDSFGQEKPVCIRVNTLKTTSENATRELSKSGIHATQVTWYQDAYILNTTTARQITDLDLYQRGDIYIQSLSSMIPALVLDPKASYSVLDMCAAPGSKTTQIATLMKNEGKIVANDMSNSRIYKLRANLEQQGVTNTIITNFVGQSLWKKYQEHFDNVLVDAPCSMEGRFSTLDPSTYSDWSETKISRLAKQQHWLLRSAVSAAKVGGTIVYSTCTLAPEENEGVIDWILEKENGRVELETVSIEGLEAAPAVNTWKYKQFNQSLSKTLRIYPSASMEGFYIAKLKKIKSNVGTISNTKS